MLAMAFAHRQRSQRCELLIGETRSFERNDRGRREIGEREREREKESKTHKKGKERREKEGRQIKRNKRKAHLISSSHREEG